jgi:hypothetical protein
MNNHKPTSEDDGFSPDALAEALRREAIDERPAFSMNLHSRIIESVNGSGAEKSSRRSRVRWWSAAVAAALVIGAGAWAAWMNRPQTADPTQVIARGPTTDVPGVRPRPIDLRRLVRQEYLQARLVVPIDPALLGLTADAAQPTTTPAASPPPFPKGLIAAFRPRDDAKLALSRLVPPEVRILGKLAEPVLPQRSTSDKPL